MRRSISLFLLLALTVCLFSGCIYTDSLEHEQTPETQTEQVTETTEAPTPSLWMSFSDDTTTYYCWEDGTVSLEKNYDKDTTLYWENDLDDQVVYVSNAVGVVAQYAYKTLEDVKNENKPAEQALVATVFDTQNNITYYCWDDGSATTTKEWNPGFYTWTKPWNGEFYNIYNGSSATGRVLYSERSCDWCDKHLVYYYTFIRCGDTLEGNYLCESCHDELRAFYNRCSVCDYYYVQYNEENHTDMCDYCAGY